MRRYKENVCGIGEKDSKSDESTSATCSIDRIKPFKMAHPRTCLRILFYRDTTLVLWLSSSPYAVWYCVQISIPLIYYGFNELQIGLTYLAGATGVILGSYLNGKMMDRKYKFIARSI